VHVGGLSERVDVRDVAGNEERGAPAAYISHRLLTSAIVRNASASPTSPPALRQSSRGTSSYLTQHSRDPSPCVPSSRMSTLLVCGISADCDSAILIDHTNHIEKRKGEAERIRQKYPDRIPVCGLSLISIVARLVVVLILGSPRSSARRRIVLTFPLSTRRSILCLR
jgi:hypothetical protein